MLFFDKKAALTAFYYLMLADGDVSAAEEETFNALGAELAGDSFAQYRGELIEQCLAQMDTKIDPEDQADVAMEGVDIALTALTDTPEEGISPRHLVWNLLTVAFSSGSYDPQERRFIKHVVRTCGVDHAVFAEMEEIMKASLAVARELEWLAASDRPYAQMRPIVDEMEKRRAVIMRCAQQLIEDEYFTPVEKLESIGSAITGSRYFRNFLILPIWIPPKIYTEFYHL